MKNQKVIKVKLIYPKDIKKGQGKAPSWISLIISLATVIPVSKILSDIYFYCKYNMYLKNFKLFPQVHSYSIRSEDYLLTSGVIAIMTISVITSFFSLQFYNLRKETKKEKLKKRQPKTIKKDSDRKKIRTCIFINFIANIIFYTLICIVVYHKLNFAFLLEWSLLGSVLGTMALPFYELHIFFNKNQRFKNLMCIFALIAFIALAAIYCIQNAENGNEKAKNKTEFQLIFETEKYLQQFENYEQKNSSKTPKMYAVVFTDEFYYTYECTIENNKLILHHRKPRNFEKTHPYSYFKTFERIDENTPCWEFKDNLCITLLFILQCYNNNLRLV